MVDTYALVCSAALTIVRDRKIYTKICNLQMNLLTVVEDKVLS